MKILSINQPWASLIVSGAVDVANLDFGTDFTGRILIHAAEHRMTEDFFEEVPVEWAKSISNEQTYGNLQMDHELPRNSIVGAVDLVTCTQQQGDSPWESTDPVLYKWHFANPMQCDSAVEHPEIPAGFTDSEIVEAQLPESYDRKRQLPKLEGATLVIPVASMIYEQLTDVEDFSLYLDWDAAYMQHIFQSPEQVEQTVIRNIRFNNVYFNKERVVKSVSYCAEKDEEGKDALGASRTGGECLYDYVLFDLKSPYE